MLEKNTEQNLKTRLILAGLKELEEHGIHDFSLRHVALIAEVSCAAPYRHFKDKEELILAIIDYVKEGWNLLSSQISQVFYNDASTLIRELSVSFIRFWIANGNFRSVLFITENSSDKKIKALMSGFDSPIIDAITSYSTQKKLSEEQKTKLVFATLSTLYGTISLINNQTFSLEQAIDYLKDRVSSFFQ